MEVRTLQSLMDRIITAIPLTTLKNVITEIYDLYVIKLEKEINKMEFETDLLEKEKQMRANASRNCEFSDLRRLVDEKRHKLNNLEEELEDINRRINNLDDKLSGQTIIEKRRLERGFEAEKDYAKIKGE